ncbi:hypothetical protein ACT691_14460 [Vibrio metschnikovii]
MGLFLISTDTVITTINSLGHAEHARFITLVTAVFHLGVFMALLPRKPIKFANKLA